LVLVLVAAWPAQAGEILFRIEVAYLGLSAVHLNQGRSLDDVVELALPGELYEPPRELGPVTAARADRSSPTAAMQSDFSAWKADDAGWILANFAESERPALSAFLADAEQRAASSAYFGSFDKLFLWGVARYGDYALALVTYGQGESRKRGLTATLVQEDGAWRRSNALSRDLNLDLVWTAFRAGEMAARP
jgi:hypothetical protein